MGEARADIATSIKYSTSAEVASCLARLGNDFQVNADVNPFYLGGDFNGDGRTDYAVAIRHARSRGIAVCWADGSHVVLGAGSTFHGMSDLDFAGWTFHSKRQPVQRGVGEAKLPKLIGDAILLRWEESASALVLWNGNQFQWYQQGD